MNMHENTIAAIATAGGTGGIAIVRVSGGEAEAILKKMFIPAVKREYFESHRLMYGRAVDADGEALDEVMAVLMRAPSTYTREDVAEIHCHGGSASANAVLARALSLGARMAGPGEFTRRAFMNGRIDLARAEAVMQLIGANGQAAARASLRQLEGGVSGFVRKASDRLMGVMALLENAKGQCVVYGRRATIWNYLVGMVDTTGRPIYQPDAQAGREGYLIGCPVKVEEAVAANKLLIGFPEQVVGNMVQDIEIESMRKPDIRVIEYTGYARFECKLMASKAFALYTVKQS